MVPFLPFPSRIRRLSTEHTTAVTLSNIQLEVMIISKVRDIYMENKSHRGNYKGTTAMKAKNQDMAFVNDTIEGAKSVTPFSEKKKKTD